MMSAKASQDYSEYMNVAVQVVLDAANLLEQIASASSERQYTTKLNATDLVTSADISLEKYVSEHLQQSFPSHQVFGEESASAIPFSEWKEILSQGYVWVLDPVDGTTNWVHGFPFVCISLALVVEGIVQVGVVYDPYQKQLFTSCRGKGAFCNHNKLRVSNVEQLCNALVVTEFGYVRDPQGVQRIVNALKQILLKGVQGVRQTGCGILDLCKVASGQVDALYVGVGGEGWKPWDYAAAALIIEEAGGTITTLDGNTFELCSNSLVCGSSTALVTELTEILQYENF
eukprot:jgi/Galph1/627/GphlegSOOS_G5430.1